MDVTDILPQLERLDGEIDDLEEVLKPLLGSLAEMSSKLPLLDKAKLYVLMTYSIESLMFCKVTTNSFLGVRANRQQRLFDSMESTQKNIQSSRN
jgi:hypothetical protein